MTGKCVPKTFTLAPKGRGCNQIRGSAMLLTLVFTLALLLMLSTLANLYRCESLMAGYHTGAEQALYLAEAGLEKVRAMMNNDLDSVIGNQSITLRLGAGEVRVEINSPDPEHLVGVKATAWLKNGIRQTVMAQMNLNTRVGILADRIITNCLGTGTCSLDADVAVKESGFFGVPTHTGALYTGYALGRINLDGFQRQAEQNPSQWQRLDGPHHLVAADFMVSPNIFVTGDVVLDESIAGCPAGSLVVATGGVVICPRYEPGQVRANLNLICNGELEIRGREGSVICLDGYLHSNSRVIIDLPEQVPDLSWRGIIEGSEVAITHYNDFIFQEDHSGLEVNHDLKQSLAALNSYRELPE